MKTKFIAPIAVFFVSVLCLIGINLGFQEKASASTPMGSYLIKHLQPDQILFVQPRLSLGDLSPDAVMASLEEIGQTYTVQGSKLQLRNVNGRTIPGLFVFVNPLTAQAVAEEGSEL